MRHVIGFMTADFRTLSGKMMEFVEAPEGESGKSSAH